MRSAYLSYNNIVSSVGFDSASVVDRISEEVSGLRLVDKPEILDRPFYSSMISGDVLDAAFNQLDIHSLLSRPGSLARISRSENGSLLTNSEVKAPLPRSRKGFHATRSGDGPRFTRLEKMMSVSLEKTLKLSGLELTDRVGFIVSTTKGNIDVLEKDSPFSKERAYLGALGERIQTLFGFSTQPIILSNACVSGILAIAVAKRLIAQRKFDHVFVVAGDLVTKFIISGFNSFQALSDEPCRPYCKSRSGINIGEVAASVLITKDKNRLVDEAVEIFGEASCNDANHISGPSRTGEGLYRSVISAMKDAKLSPEDIDYISAHGTATMFNDEMEAIAFNRAGLGDTPLNSLKGYFGHTLGASGLLETIVGMHSLHRNTLFASKGFQGLGVSQSLNIIEKTTRKKLNTFLKSASGFGGSNTAAVFRKV